MCKFLCIPAGVKRLLLGQVILVVIVREGAGAKLAQIGSVAGCAVELSLIVSQRNGCRFSQTV